MNTLRTFITCTLLTLFAQSPPTAKGWRGIIPLRSTRADVERLLGAAPKKTLVVYDRPDEIVTVVYEVGKCSATVPEELSGISPGWNVPKDTVVSVDVRLKKRVMLATLNLELRDYKKEAGSDVPQIARYLNESEGFGLEVFELRNGTGERVMSYFYVPTKEEERLRCPAGISVEPPPIPRVP